MEPIKVPQHLELEDVLAFGLGAGDLLHVLGGGLVGWWLYLEAPLPWPLRTAAALVMILAGLLLGALSFGERRLRAWLLVIAGFALRPRLRLYGAGR